MRLRARQVASRLTGAGQSLELSELFALPAHKTSIRVSGRKRWIITEHCGLWLMKNCANFPTFSQIVDIDIKNDQ
jgi:hypothetical protein